MYTTDTQLPMATAKRRGGQPIFSLVLPDGALVEMVHDRVERRTRFAIWRDGTVTYDRKVAIESRVFVPYSPQNSLLEHAVILLPSEAAEYGSEAELLAEITAYIHRYCDLMPVFERLVSHYVLLTWVYDGFNELPYVRVRGDAGSGKTRFLLVVGSLCFKPIFASGASTVSPIFRILDACRGTLVIDEGDFRFSDEKAEMVKILNQGHARGFPVLRTESENQRELNPRAYQVFGPKIVATRGLFDDRALESRCITEVLGGRRLREDIPINLPDEQKEEALQLRNKLLMFRFRHYGRVGRVFWIDRHLEPRLNQVFGPLMSIIEDEVARSELRTMAYTYQDQLVTDRGLDTEAQVLEIIQDLEHASFNQELSIKIITSRFGEKYEQEYDRKITPRWIGGVIRQRLGLATERRQGHYVIATSDRPKLARLYEKYGLAEREEAVP